MSAILVGLGLSVEELERAKHRVVVGCNRHRQAGSYPPMRCTTRRGGRAIMPDAIDRRWKVLAVGHSRCRQSGFCLLMRVFSYMQVSVSCIVLHYISSVI